VRSELAFALATFLPTAPAAGQQPAAPVPRPAIAQPASVTVHYAGAGVSAPVMFPPSVSIFQPRHCIPIIGVVKLSALVDENGLPRSIQALRSDDPRLSDFAIGLVAAQRFKPGKYNGSAATIAIGLTAALHTCALPPKKKSVDRTTTFALSSQPFLSIAILNQPSPTVETPEPAPFASAKSYIATDRREGKISAPEAIFQPNPQYSNSARHKDITGTCLIGATVDANGVPENVHVVASLEPSLDLNSVETIKTWRFNPALQNESVPVPFELTIAVTFWNQAKLWLSFTTIVPKAPGDLAFSAGSNSTENITPPVPLNADEVQAEYSPYGRLAHITGLCVVAFTVDTNGVPQNVRIVKSLESSMDENVVSAVNALRFSPAKKNARTPVTAEVILPVRFRLRIDKRKLFENALTAAILIFGV
jgi:TonB family protein